MSQKTCSVCGETFKARRRDARFCSPRCRKSAERLREALDSARDGAISAIRALRERITEGNESGAGY